MPVRSRDDASVEEGGASMGGSVAVVTVVASQVSSSAWVGASLHHHSIPPSFADFSPLPSAYHHSHGIGRPIHFSCRQVREISSNRLGVLSQKVSRQRMESPTVSCKVLPSRVQCEAVP